MVTAFSSSSVLWNLKMLRYIILHNFIPNLLDYFVFDPIKDWVREQLGNGGEVPGVNGDSDQRHNTTAVNIGGL